MLALDPGSRSAHPPAVVMGLGVTGLSVARALGRRGLTVYGIADPRALGTASRYVRHIDRPGAPGDDGALRHYLAVASRIGPGAVLVPTGDPDVLFISRHRDVLAEHFAFHLADRDLVEAVASKRRAVALAVRCCLPIPTTVLPEDRDELERCVPRLRFPCVIKPEFTQLWRTAAAAAGGLGESKAIPAADVDALFRWYDRLARIDARLVVQEMVMGPDENHLDYHALVDREGRTRGEFAGRKLRLNPPHFGSGCYVESIHSEEVLKAGRAVLHQLGYRGMANLNFKRDARDGRLYLLEVNPRFSIWNALDVACGVDFPYYYYCTALGEHFEVSPTYPAGRRWLNPVTDFRAMRTYARDGSWSWRQWLGTLAGVSVNAVLAWDDLRPGIRLVLRALAARTVRAPRRESE